MQKLMVRILGACAAAGLLAGCNKAAAPSSANNSIGNVTGNQIANAPSAPIVPEPPPQSAPCADANTVETVKDILFDGAEKAASVDNRLVLIQIRPQTTVHIELPLFDGRDNETQKTNCEGRIHIILPYRSGVTNNDLTQQINYYVQPAADGSGNVVGVSGLNNLQAALAFSDLSPWASATKTVSSAQPFESPPITATTTTDVDAPSTAPTTIVPGMPTYPTSFNCSKARGYAEVTICTDAELAADDIRLSRLYRAKLISDKTGQTKSAGRVAWNARQRCSDRQCLVDWYLQQTAAYIE